MDLILLAIPFFFLLMLIELVYGIARKRNTYRLNDTINSLSMGSLSRLQALVFLGFSAAIYEIIVARFQLGQLPDDSPWVWVSCFVLYDLAYYWKHRLGHEVALFWGSHVAHHQSEDYNLSTALRQTSIDFHSFLFYLPFFFAGYPAEILFSVASLNLIYQFWVHTEHVPKLGLLEWVFVTPSNHRVHHARNDIYVDRNYGGVFIIWDRIFGSFQDELEDEPAVFGLRKPLNSWNPLWANVHVYWRLLRDFLQAPGMLNKLKLLLKPPGWQIPGMNSSCQLRKDKIDLSSRFDPEVPDFNKFYTFAQFLLSVAFGLTILLNAGNMSYSLTAISVGFVAYSFFVHGLWLEGRSSASAQELFRLILLATGIQLIGVESTISLSVASLAVISIAVVVWHGKSRRMLAAR